MNTRLSDLEQLVSEIKKFRPDCKVAIDYLNKVIDKLKYEDTICFIKIKQIMEIENIKFKAKQLNSEKWFEGDLIRKSNGIYIRRHKYLSAIVDASTVCIFTGLTDKNGTPIYEGGYSYIQR